MYASVEDIRRSVTNPEGQLSILKEAQENIQVIPDRPFHLAPTCEAITRVVEVTATSKSTKLEHSITDGFASIENYLEGGAI